MSALSRIAARIRNFTTNKRIDARLQEEMAQHIELQTEDNVRAGMPAAEARRQAKLKFGPVQAVRESYHREEGLPLLESLLQDLRFALRLLRKSRGFTLVTVMTLALGIGANTTVFSIVDAVLLRPLPYSHPEQLVEVQSGADGQGESNNISYPDFFDWRTQNRSFEQLVSYHSDSYILTGGDQPAHVAVVISSWNLLPMLGVKPEIGRGFAPEEERRGMRVVLLSHALWQTQFGADPAVVGRVVPLSGQRFTVIGVMPAAFQFPAGTAKTDVWTTLAVDDLPSSDGIGNRGSHYLNAMGRLRPGIKVAQADQEMNAMTARLAQQYPNTNLRHNSVQVRPELDALLGDRKLLMLVILCAVGLVLLIACGNIANMLLARLGERTREIAMRAALGASRARIVRQLLLESLVLSLTGGVAGCLLAFVATPLVLRLVGESVPRAADASANLAVLGFALVTTVAAGVLFGMLPAMKAAKTDLVTSLKAGGTANVGGHSRLRAAVIVGEVALGIVLTAGAGLLTSSFVRLMHSPIGFQPDHVLTFRFELPDDRYEKTHAQFYRDYFERLRSLPGVESAAGTLMLPMTGKSANVSFQNPEQPVPAGQRPSAAMSIVTPGYFHTMQTPVLKGRDFSDADTMESQQVMIVNQALANRIFPGKDPIGKGLKPGMGNGSPGGPPMRQIIGVVGNIRGALTERSDQPGYYLPNAQFPGWCCLYSTLRSSGDPRSLEPAVRHLVQSIDKELPVTDVLTMPDLMSLQLAQPRFAMVLLGAFAGLALLLTVIGLYGVLMYSVTRRTREIGVRLALGAERAAVLRMVLRDAAKLVGAGIAIGLAVSLAFSSVLKTMLYGTAERDPVVLTAVCCVVAVTALFAAWLPAVRAAAIEPMVALRHE